MRIWGRGIDPVRFDPARRCERTRRQFAPGGETLVGYVGRLAAETMLAWLQRAELPEEERARAYSLLPSTARTRSGTLAGSC
ncbi:MAG: glycosyltransferase family 1 protein, partial [Myxococcota bacterium]